MEWPLPVLLIICGVLWTLRRGTRWDSLLLALLGSFLAGYAAYWHDGFFDGPRFLFPVAPVLLVYLARMPEAAEGMTHVTRRRVARLVVPACLLCSWLVPLPFSSVPGRLIGQRDQRSKLKTDVVAQVKHAPLENLLGQTEVVVFVREPWRARLLARLRGLGVRQFDAEQVVNTTDACAVQLALDDADTAPSADTGAMRATVLARARAAGPARVQANVIAESQVARAVNGPDAPRCRDELAADTLGTMPYGMFLREQQVEHDGRLGGDVIWVRDLGARDTLLNAALGGRLWYLYKPGRSADDAATFLPYGGGTQAVPAASPPIRRVPSRG
jgi:hypothetical protein